ncbi:MAG: DNA alkylation repair protein [Clostridiales bacterium]|nr:DNA alkylation repair protein [Clostridiales bacterium]
MSLTDFKKLLFDNFDTEYAKFSKKLIPDSKYDFIGVRVPDLKKIAKTIVKEKKEDQFLESEHKFYEEYFLHGLILGYCKKDVSTLIKLIKEFLPYIDNWAICDGTVQSLKIFKKHPAVAQNFAFDCLKSNKPYTVRFGIVTLLTYFLDENFSQKVIDEVVKINFDNYYVNMAIAWFLSVALVKQYKSAISYIESKSLPKFIQNKTIQKAIESFRISKEEKEFLKYYKL